MNNSKIHYLFKFFFFSINNIYGICEKILKAQICMTTTVQAHS